MKKKYTFILLTFLLFAGLIYTYSNHFKNGFYFDDSHTIVNNAYIRDLSNIPQFFTNIATFGTMPENRGYRPMVTTLNAIDYWLAGNKLNSFYFHLHIFFDYLLILICLFFILKKWFEPYLNKDYGGYLSWLCLLCVSYFAFLTANADTLNYIIARSDLFSTLCILAALLCFMWKKGRKYYLYLIPYIIGLFSKEVTVVFIPLVFFYELIIKQNKSLWDVIWLREFKAVVKSIAATLPAIIIGAILMWLNLKVMRNTNTANFTGGFSVWDYFTTQFIVIAHYIGNFFLPLNLSADPDFSIIHGFLHSEKIFAFIFIVGLHILAIYFSARKEWRPAAMGIIWFFVCLMPTSTFKPLGQVANDHRTFLPYIGLVIAVFWSIYRFYCYCLAKGFKAKNIFLASYALIIASYAYGAHQRNKVWSSDKTLWHDVTIKSPKNSRGLMNYGLALMREGNYKEAEVYFKKTLKMSPYWSYIHINMGILEAAMGKDKQAVIYFNNALKYGASDPEPYYYYARYLFQHRDYDGALVLIKKGLAISPEHVGLKKFYKEVNKYAAINAQSNVAYWQKIVKNNPSHDNYINLSLAYYKQGDFNKCIEACNQALKQKPNSSIAYNNIGSAYNKLKEWDKAIIALKKAIQIDSSNNYAKNNLKIALSKRKQQQNAK